MINIKEDIPTKLSGLSSLYVSFNYNPEIVNIIKCSDKYIYDKNTYVWELPLTSLAYLLDNLTYIDDITLTIIQDNEKKEHFYPKLTHKYPPFKHQLDAIEYGLNNDVFAILDSPGIGKAFSLDTKVLTDCGYKEIRDVHINDTVFDKEGNACKVTAEYLHETLNMYRIKFSTGYEFTCCEDHLWPIIHNKPVWHNDAKKYSFEDKHEVRDIKWLSGFTERGTPRYKAYFCRIPFCRPVQFKEKKHLIHPYILGVLIGDGSLHNSLYFTSADSFIVNKVRSLLPEGFELKKKKAKYSYRIVMTHRVKENAIFKELKRLKLLVTSYFKYIPDEYKYDSIENRLALLQGLMDTDGTSSSGKTYTNAYSNNASFSTSSSRLKDDFEFLINSLGGYVTIHQYRPGYFNKKYNEYRTSKFDSFTIGIHLNNLTDVVSLPRKKQYLSQRKFEIRNKIIDIQYIGQMPGKCLTVNSPSHTYLVDKCTVTHNTLQAIYLAEELKEQKGLEHCLIICGINTLKANWKKEIQKFSTLPCKVIGERRRKNGTIYYASVKERAAEIYEKCNEFFLICNVENLRSDDFVQAIKTSKNNIGMIVVDEAHRVGASGLKSQQTNGLLKLTKYEHKIPMTGTAILNRPIDCYVMLRWMGVEKANLTNFKSQYCIYGGFGNHQIVGYKNLDLLKNELESCSIRRKKEDLMDLPPKTIIPQIIEMDDKHQQFYDNVKDGVKEQCDKIELNSGNVLALTTRLRQATSCPSILTTESIMSSKIQRAIELTEDILATGDKVVIMSTFKEPLKELYNLLKEYNPLIGSGDLSDDEVSKNVDLFQTQDKYKVFLGTTAKCGTGITLNAASYMICIDTPWTAALQEQVEDRINRITNTKSVTIYRLICQGTIDEAVENIIETKQAISDFIVDNKVDEHSLNILRSYIQDL